MWQNGKTYGKSAIWGVLPLNIDISISTKGIAAVLVVLYHFSMYFSINIKIAPTLFGYGSVALFFFWSGFGMTLGAQKETYLKTFWKNRLIKILTPFLIAAVIYTLFHCVGGEKYTFLSYISSLIFVNLVNHSWYIFALLIFCVIFYLVKKKIYNNTFGGIL